MLNRLKWSFFTNQNAGKTEFFVENSNANSLFLYRGIKNFETK